MNGAGVGTPARGSRKWPQAPRLSPCPPFPPRPTRAVIHAGGGPGRSGAGRRVRCGLRSGGLSYSRLRTGFPIGLGEG